MADDTKTTKTVLDLDNADFLEKLQQSMGLMGDFAENVSGLAEKFVAFGEIAGIVGAAFLAFKVAVDLTEEAEKIDQVNKSFQLMAQSAGLAADVLKEDLVKAAGGLASETDLLQSANKAIVTMGDNASRLPEIMDLARKATAVFGGDLLQNFNTLNSALAGGNTRMLKQYGIIVDATKAHQEYAQSLGVGVEFLSQAGQKQAVFNAAIEQAKQKYADVDVNLTQTTNNMQRIGVSLTEIKEMAALAWNALAGPTVTKVVSNISDMIHGLAVRMKAAFGTGKDQADAQRESLERQIASYQQITAHMDKQSQDYKNYMILLAQAEQQLQKINAEDQKNVDLKKKQAQSGGTEATGAGNVQQDQVNYEKLKQARIKFEADILAIKKQADASSEKSETDAVAFQKLRDEEMVQLAQEASNKIQKLKVDGLDKGLISEQQYAQAVSNIQKKLEADITVIRQKSHQDEITALKNLQKQQELTAAGFSASMKLHTAEASADMQNFAKLGDTTFNALKSNAVSAFQAMGNGSKSAGDAMKGFLFGTIGDVAQAQGTEVLLASVWPPNPVGIAAGGALIALGEALKSVGSSSGSSAPTASASAASAPSAQNLSTGAVGNTASTPTPQATQQKNALTVAIQGNYFETDQTRTRLMEMIRETGDITDFNLAKIGQT